MSVLIKLSGGALGTEEEKYSEDTIATLAEHIKALQEQGVAGALVVGGGNLFRGKDLAGTLAVRQSTADYIGMLAIAQNALVLRDYFTSCGVETRVLSAIDMPQVCETYFPEKAMRHLAKGRITIFASGLGLPFFTTDSSAVQRALEIDADMLILAKDGVDGLYTEDPQVASDAERIDHISASEVLARDLKVADTSAIALARDHGLPIKVVGFSDIARAHIEGVGSMITPE